MSSELCLDLPLPLSCLTQKPSYLPSSHFTFHTTWPPVIACFSGLSRFSFFFVLWFAFIHRSGGSAKIREGLGTLITWCRREVNVGGWSPTTNWCAINHRASFLPVNSSTVDLGDYLGSWLLLECRSLVCYFLSLYSTLQPCATHMTTSQTASPGINHFNWCSHVEKMVLSLLTLKNYNWNIPISRR